MHIDDVLEGFTNDSAFIHKSGSKSSRCLKQLLFSTSTHEVKIQPKTNFFSIILELKRNYVRTTMKLELFFF